MAKINFKIGLSIITHDAVNEHPFVNISLNGFPQSSGFYEQDTVVNFDIEIEDNKQNFLTIEYLNKDAKQDVVLDEDGLPVLDKRVEINRISIDDIALDFFAFDLEDTLKYEPIDPAFEIQTGFGATKLSWNGSTTLKFTTPLYLWILENI